MALRSNFSKKNVRSLFLNQLSNKLKKSLKSSIIMSKEEVKACILNLSEIVPGWIVVVSNIQGTLIRLVNKKKLSEIVSKLRESFKKGTN